MREARLAGTQARPAADDRRGRRAVMRRAERRRLDQRMLRRQQPGNGMDARHLECLVGRERRQDPRQTPPEHRLPRPRRAAEQQVVPARRRELERAPRPLLAAHVREIRQRRDDAAVQRQHRIRLEVAAEIRDRVGEVPDRDRLDARERRLGRRLRRTEQPLEPHAAARPRRPRARRRPAAAARRARARRRTHAAPARRAAPAATPRAPPARSANRTRSPPSAARPARDSR